MNTSNPCADALDTLPPPSRATSTRGWFARAAAELRAMFERNRTRPRLSVLDERMLRDIGLTPDLADAESRKSFWRL
jgi:uncharacterized protein YjiS (DUF1127 family)